MHTTLQTGSDRDRGQAHTLEGIAAALLILTGVIVALQLTAVTPLTANTASQHLQNQAASAAEGALMTAADRGELKDTVLYWNGSADRFHHSGVSGQYSTAPPTEFGTILERSLGAAGLVYNVNVLYVSSAGDQRSRVLVHRGEPSDRAVTVTRTVTLYDGDRLRAPDESPTNRTLEEADGYFIRDVSRGPLYNVLRVEVVIWQA
ncbi:MAG: hypothetical protein ABEJ60_00850 [Halodesulfurarchaeum sp.]